MPVDVTTSFRNLKFTLRTDLVPDKVISGTYNEASFHGELSLIPYYDGGANIPTYDYVGVINCNINLHASSAPGSQLTDLAPYWPIWIDPAFDLGPLLLGTTFSTGQPSSGPLNANVIASGDRAVRFSSTEHPDNSDITFSVSLSAEVVYLDENGPVIDSIDSTFKLDMQGGHFELTHIKQRTYNKGLTMATPLELSNGTFQVFTPPKRFGFSVATVQGAQHARTAFSQTNHSVINGSSDMLSESLLASYMKEATVFFLHTHASGYDLLSSLGESMSYTPVGASTPNEIKSYIQDNRVKPQLEAVDYITGEKIPLKGPNMVIVHGCSSRANLLGTRSYAQVKDIAVQSGETAKVRNRIHAGFTYPVYSIIEQTDEDNAVLLSSHAKKLYDMLAAGYVADVAITAANEAFPPSTINLQGQLTPMPMSKHGDGYARLRYVYTGTKPIPSKKWWLSL